MYATQGIILGAISLEEFSFDGFPILGVILREVL
jgi:hypothetical protein